MSHNVNAKLCPACGYARPLTEFYVTRPGRGSMSYSTCCKKHDDARQTKRHDAQLRRAASLRAVLRKHGLASR